MFERITNEFENLYFIVVKEDVPTKRLCTHFQKIHKYGIRLMNYLDGLLLLALSCVLFVYLAPKESFTLIKN